MQAKRLLVKLLVGCALVLAADASANAFEIAPGDKFAGKLGGRNYKIDVSSCGGGLCAFGRYKLNKEGSSYSYEISVPLGGKSTEIQKFTFGEKSLRQDFFIEEGNPPERRKGPKTSRVTTGFGKLN